MISALALLSIYRSPAIPLADVCERFFSLSYEEAMRRAARNELPVPVFRLSNSQKAPMMVSAQALGEWIDKTESEARSLCLKSQIR